MSFVRASMMFDVPRDYYDEIKTYASTRVDGAVSCIKSLTYVSDGRVSS